MALSLAATGFTFFLHCFPLFLWNAAQKKSKQKSQVPLNRSAYRNGHAFWHSTVTFGYADFYLAKVGLYPSIVLFHFKILA